MRAKTNWLVKALVCLQASWLVAQVTGRAIAQLPITTLEIVTVGYVVCALITYSCNWCKPQDAEVPLSVHCDSLTRASFHKQIESLQDTPFVERWWETALVLVVVATFGAVHCTAWNFFFPTSAEGFIWRVASILTVITPWALVSMTVLKVWDQIILPASMVMPTALIWGGISDPILDWMFSLFVVLWNVLGCVSIVVGVSVRLFLFIEPFIAFRSVPVGIFYTVNWSNWIPHV